MATNVTRVYKFLPADLVLDDLREHHIKISTFPDMNDPFELLGGLPIDAKLRHHLNSLLARLNEWCGVLCFTRDWHNAMLWSHYGDKHRGIWLGLDIISGPQVELLKPNYVASRKKFDADLRILLAAAPRWKSLKISDKEFQDCMGVIKRLITTKFNALRYEKELRMCIALKDDQKKGARYFAEFDSHIQARTVIVGARCITPSKDIEAAIYGYSPAITVVRTMLSPDSFQIIDQKAAR
jgi:hypothetical protein